MTVVYNKEIITKIFINSELTNIMCRLAARWLEECYYEDIDDYANAVKDVLSHIVGDKNMIDSIKMTRKPFGFKARIYYIYTIAPEAYADGVWSELTFKLTASGQYSWDVKPIPSK